MGEEKDHSPLDIKEKIDITKGDDGRKLKPAIDLVPHGRERVFIGGAALAICLISPIFPFTPDNVRTGLLTIGGSIATSLFKGFEKH